MAGETKSKPSSYGLTKKKIIDLIKVLENKAPENAAKLKKEFGIKMKNGGLPTMKKKTKYMAKGGAGMKKTKYMAKGGMKKTMGYARGGAAKKK